MSIEVISTSDQLGLEDLGEVYEALADISQKWYYIGLALGVSVSRLDTIKEQYPKFEEALLETLKLWLKQTLKPRRWAALVEALRRKTIQEDDVAASIERDHAMNRSLSAPADLTNTTQVHSHVQSMPCKGTQSSIQQQRTNPRHTIHEIQNVSNFVSSSSPPPSSCHPEENTDSTGDKLSVEKPLYPYLNTEGLTEDEKRTLCGRLTNEYKRITSSYATLNQDIRNSLQTRGVTPGQLASVLMELSAFPLKIRDSSKPLLEDCVDEIEAAKSVQDVFKILRPYGSFFDCHIIKHIVNSELCTDGDRDKLHGYLSKLDNYCQRNVFECPHFASSDAKFPKLMIKVDDIVSAYFTMKALDAFSADVAETLKLSRHTLRVCSVQEGCILLTYQISRSIVDEIFPLNPEQEKALKSLGLSSLTCGQRWKYNLGASQAQKRKDTLPQCGPPSTSLLPLTGCIRYRLTGKCPFGDKCHYGHLNKPIANPSIGIVPTPSDRSLVGRVFQSSGGKGYIIMELKDNSEKVKILAEDDLTLKYAKRITRGISPSFSTKKGSVNSRFKYIYVHPEGVEQPDLFLKFDKHIEEAMTKTNYHHQRVQPIGMTNAPQQIENFECLNPPCMIVGSLLDKLEHREAAQVYSVSQICKDFRKEIHEQLRQGLSWMHKKGFPKPKLEGRLGKVLWRRCLKDSCLNVEKFVRFVVERETVRGSSFSSTIDGKNCEALRRINVLNVHSTADEYLFSLQPKNNTEGQHYVCVTFKPDGEPDIIRVTKHNRKDWTTMNFDILCLHRQYDIRVSLRNIETVSATDPSLQRFISSTLRMSQPGVIHYNPKESKEEWSLIYIHHQKLQSYNFRDSKYMVEIADIGGYTIKEGDFSEHRIGSNDFSPRHEIELHCTSWDSYSDRYVDPSVDSTTSSHSWSPDAIMKDFEKDGFLKMMDELNQTLELMSLSQ